MKIEGPVLGRLLLMAVAGFVLMSICYLALGQAKAQAEAVEGVDCIERTVDASFFDVARSGEPTVICATEISPSSPAKRTALPSR